MVAGGLSPAFNPLLLCPTLTIPLLRPVPRRRHNQYKKDEKRGEGTCLGEGREGMVRVHDLSAQGLRRPEPAEGRQCFRAQHEKIEIHATLQKRVHTFNQMPFEYLRTDDGKFRCPHCDFVKERQSTVHMHIRAKHMGAFKHKCEHCEYETSTQQNLENHMLNKHAGLMNQPAPHVSCPACDDYQCRTKAQLRSHYLLNHLAKEVHDLLDKKETSWNCKQCESVFKSKAAFVYHSVKCLHPSLCSLHKEGLGM
jgi:hypothetical protein